MKPIVILPEAQADLLEAVDWYRARSAETALKFDAAINAALLRIAEAPDRWPQADAGNRFHLVSRFPYYVIYRLEPARILIATFAHASRNPGYWKNR